MYSMLSAVVNIVFQPVCKKAHALMHPQGRSHQIWSGQVSGTCVSMQQLGGACPTRNFLNLEAMRLLLRQFLGQNNASRRPDDRVLHT